MQIEGVIHTTQLNREVGAPVVRSWLRAGRIRTVGVWYVTPSAPADLVAVLAEGVRPTCLDGAAMHGLWIPVHPGVHAYRPRTTERTAQTAAPLLPPIRRRIDPRTGVVLPPLDPVHGGRARIPQPLVLHAPVMRRWPDRDPVPVLPLILEHAARCLPVVQAAVLIESALNLRRLSGSELENLLRSLPLRTRRQLARVRNDAQSGSETRVRWWFESRHVPVRAQVQLHPRIRVDLLVGATWVIECDSRRHHDDPAGYAADRERDLVLTALGYHVTRLTWEQVNLHWERTEVLLLQILHRRDHRRTLRA